MNASSPPTPAPPGFPESPPSGLRTLNDRLGSSNPPPSQPAVPESNEGPNQAKPGPPLSRVSTRRGRNGKVARLPKAIRDQINLLLRDGLSYRAIIKKLGDDARELTLNNLSEWKRGGYVDWLEELHWAEQLRAQQESALELLRSQDEIKFNQVILQIGLTQICQTLRAFSPATLSGMVNGDLSAFTRLLNSLARLSREALV